MPKISKTGTSSVKQIDQLKIFSRWGEMVYQQENIPSDRKIGWNGTLNGQNLDPGVFVFIAKVTFIDGTEAVYKGDITLLK